MKFVQNDTTICAIATGSGKGAIAVIRVSGNKTFEIVEKVFKGKKPSDVDSHTIHFGTIRDENNTVVDEVLISVFKRPHSFTGENSVEISCHGSSFIQKRIIELLLQNGCMLALPGEFTLRAFLNGKMDLSQAEAVADVIASDSEAALKVALQQMRGGYSKDIKALRQELLHFASLIELELDFAEEDVEFADREGLRSLVNKITSSISSLIDSFKVGNVIKNGIPVVIAGKPNAGKSTLLNALLNEERAIVSSIAGTTRDTIEEELTINGVVFRFTDTAGLRETSDEIEQIGVSKAKEKIRTSAILLYVFDVTKESIIEVKKEIEKVVEENKLEGVSVIPVGNKCDELPPGSIENAALLPNLLLLSAKSKLNIPELKQKLYQLSNIDKALNRGTIVSNIRHYESLRHAQLALQKVVQGMDDFLPADLLAMDIRDATHHLSDITGEVSNDEVLGNIFKNFCIGK